MTLATSRIALHAVAALALLAVARHASAAAPIYSIKDLTPEGYVSSEAFDINSDGDVVGIATKYPGGTAVNVYFIYDADTGISTPFGEGIVSPRGAIIGTGFRKAAINDAGSVAGTARFLAGVAESRGFIYSGGGFTNLGTLPGAPGTGIRPASDALDINTAGIATGTATSGADTATDNIDAYKGTAPIVSDIDGDLSVATKGDLGRALNDAGLVAGSNEFGKATLFSGAAETELLAATGYAGEGSVANDLNEVGLVTGTALISNDAFIYDSSDSSVTVIPQIGTGNRMAGLAINESGDVVGKGDRSEALDGAAKGYVYLNDDATSYILEDHVILTGSDTPGLSDWGSLRTAWGINDSGQIVGVGDRRFDGAAFPNGRAYLLTPIPEPGTLVVMGLVGMGMIRRRRSR